jgi:hypothetical protein
MIMRCKAVYAMCGGDLGIKVDKKGLKEFDYRRSMLIQRMMQLDEMAKAKSSIGERMGGETSRGVIRMKLQMRSELEAVRAELTELARIASKDEDNKKLPAAELAARKEVITMLRSEMYRVHEEVTGAKHPGAGEGADADGPPGLQVLTKDNLMKGAFPGAGIKMEREALSGEQYQQLQLISVERTAQDAILDEMSATLDEVKESLDTIGDELQAQEKAIADLERKTDKTQAKMDGVNSRASDAVKKMNDKSTNCCIYLCVWAGGDGEGGRAALHRDAAARPAAAPW